MARPKSGYRLADGSKVPGVTTILGELAWNRGALIGWAFKVGQEEPDLKSPYQKRDEAAALGTALHETIEASLRGQSDNAVREALAEAVADEDAYKPVLKSLESFFRWRDMTRFEPLHLEMSLVSERHRYGGTIDVEGNCGGMLSLLDWKRTGGIYRETHIQVEAYRKLYEENYPERRLDGWLHVVRFSPTQGGFEHACWEPSDDWFAPFLLARELYDWNRRLK